MNSEQILNDLKNKYPTLSFELVSKEMSGLEEDDSIPDQLIALIFDDVAIIDLYSSDCSRFRVDPKEVYGIEKSDADLIKGHNRVVM